jgi:hypothetical protein
MPLCIPADSHHPMIHKLAAFESALYRMWAFPLNLARRESELKYIIKMAKMNGYKEETILRLNEKHKRRRKFKELCRLQPIKEDKKKKVQDKNGKETVKNVVIPYYSNWKTPKLTKISIIKCVLPEPWKPKRNNWKG